METAVSPVETLVFSLKICGASLSRPGGLEGADEILASFQRHSQALEITEQGNNAILNDPAARKKLVRKIHVSIAPILAAIYLLQYLDKTTLQYTSVMGL
ncbi:hypothetical protein AOQ84DRAFT_299590 [Glonium stellatum]|uniref:Uncharacterized protein n=1 Tax=Glonium stellatum TaxID=574774 RepID=A0A8E2EUF9_9PEZI|nr:hypothetical protein AOQ84DRAFT_299590 [Glonium stellatum]